MMCTKSPCSCFDICVNPVLHLSSTSAYKISWPSVYPTIIHHSVNQCLSTSILHTPDTAHTRPRTCLERHFLNSSSSSCLAPNPHPIARRRRRFPSSSDPAQTLLAFGLEWACHCHHDLISFISISWPHGVRRDTYTYLCARSYHSRRDANELADGGTANCALMIAFV